MCRQRLRCCDCVVQNVLVVYQITHEAPGYCLLARDWPAHENGSHGLMMKSERVSTAWNSRQLATVNSCA
jgi:hypothetical protein